MPQQWVAKLKQKLNKRRWADWLRPGSVDKELGALLVQFCKKEYSYENLVGWGHCEVFAGRRNVIVSSVPGSNAHAKLCYIYGVFGPGKPNEVNVPGAHWTPVMKLIEGQKNIPSSALDQISNDIVVTISDTLSRFQFDQAVEAYAARNGVSAGLKKLFGGGKVQF